MMNTVPDKMDGVIDATGLATQGSSKSIGQSEGRDGILEKEREEVFLEGSADWEAISEEQKAREREMFGRRSSIARSPPEYPRGGQEMKMEGRKGGSRGCRQRWRRVLTPRK